MTFYTLIAYRPNGLDTCRGCEMGRSDSAFFSMATEDRNKLIEKWGALEYQNKYSDRATCHWDILLYINGYLYHGYHDEDDAGYPDNYDDLNEDYQSIFVEKDEVKKRLIEEHEKRVILEKRAKEQKQKKLMEDREYEEFLRLKEKFQK